MISKNKTIFISTALACAISPLALSEQLTEQPVEQSTEQPTEQSIEKAIEEIVTVASYQPITVRESGSAITIIDQQYLQARKPLLVLDVLRDVPGLAVSASGVHGSQTDIRVRGAEGNHVLVLIDGIEVNDASQGDAFNWAHLSAADVARIEVIRGPQSALWGSEAVAGVISITSKQAAEGKVEATLFSEAGSFASNHVGGSIAGRGERYHYRFSADRITADGDNISRQGDERDGYRNSTVHVNGGYQLSDNTELTAVARQTVASNQFDNVDFVTGLPVDANNQTDSRQKYFRLQGQIRLLDGDWLQRYAFSQSKHDNKNFSSGAAGTSNEARKRQLQLLNSLNWHDNQQLSLLLEREEVDFSQRGPLVFGLDPNQNRHISANSAALEYRISPLDNLTLAASVRYDSNSDFDSATTERVEASYRFGDTGSRLRASYGAAVKNPTLSERFGTFSNFLGNPALQPESVNSWELGLDHRLLAVDFGLTYFNARLDDEINSFVFDPGSGRFTAANIVGTSRRQGVEATFAAALADDVSLQGTYTYTDATQPSGNAMIDEVRRPRHIGSISLDWQASDSLNVLFNAQYNGAREDDDFSTFPAVRVTLDNYTLVNTTASYQVNDRVQFYLRAENLLNEQYEDVLGFQTLGRGGYVGVLFNIDS